MRIGRKHMWEKASHDGGEAVFVEPPRPATQSRLLALALLSVALSTAGCGGSNGTPASSSKTSSSPTPSSTSSASSPGPSFTGTQPSRSSTPGKTPASSAFLAKANGICARRNAELSSNAAKSVNLAEVAGIVTRRAAVEQRALNQLDLLTPPAQIAGSWRRLLGYNRTLIGQTVQLGEYARSNNVKGIQAVSTASAGAMRELAIVARAAGVNECSRIA